MQPSAPVWNRDFVLNVVLPFAEDAYAVSDGASPVLPHGYTLVGVVRAAPEAFRTADALPSHNRAMNAMLLESDRFGLVAVNTDARTCVVALRGSLSLEDWLRDIDFDAEPYQPVSGAGWVHQGFQLVYETIRESLRGLLSMAHGAFDNILLIGHSLGGALAVLGTPDIAINLIPGITPQVYTFGAPRVAKPDFASNFDNRVPVCFRIVNKWDLVPHLPPLLAAFEHTGHAVLVDGGFTTDLVEAHRLETSYNKGLQALPPTGDSARAEPLRALIARAP